MLMPKIKLLDNADVAALVEKTKIQATAAATAAAVKAAKATTAVHVAGATAAGEKGAVKLHKAHGTAIVEAIKAAAAA